MDRKARALFSSGDIASVVKVVGYLATKLRDLLHSTGPIGTEYAEILAGVKELQALLAAGDVKALQEHPERRGKRTQERILGQDDPRPVLKRSRIVENEQAMNAPNLMLALGNESPTGDAQMADIIRKARDDPKLFSDVDLMRDLEKSVQEWNAAHPDTQQYTLLDVHVNVYGGVDKLAPALSNGKLNAESADEASRLQAELLKMWFDNGKTANNVFRLLGLSELVTRGLYYENLDTFAQYIELCNKDHSGNDELLKKHLANWFFDADFMKMIVIAGHDSKYGKMMMETRFLYWRWKDFKFTTIVKKLKKLGFDDSAIFDVLSEFYGEAEVRHAMSKSKRVGSNNWRLKQRQTWLVTDLLDSFISIDAVYNLLKLYESTNDGMTKQRMKIFQEYVQLRNNRYLYKIDAEQYRTQRLVKATRVDQERAPKRQRIEGPDVPR